MDVKLTLWCKPTLSQLSNDINRFHMLWLEPHQNRVQEGSTSVGACVRVRKIKWQAECSASTNTGASARMKGAVTTAHAGKEEKSIHPHSSVHLSSAYVMSLLVNPYGSYKKRQPLLFTPSTMQNIFFQYICFPGFILFFLFHRTESLSETSGYSKCTVLKHFLEIFPEQIRSIECAWVELNP